MRTHFAYCSRRFEISARASPAASWIPRPAAGHDRDALRQLLLRHCDPAHLRGLLDQEELAFWRWSDARVVDHVVNRLCDGSLVLLEARHEPRPPPRPQVGFGGRPTSLAATPSRLRPARATVEPVPAVLEAEEPAPELDDVAQVATLQEAALYGVPVCQECVRFHASFH